MMWWSRDLQAARHCEHGGYHDVPAIVAMLVVPQVPASIIGRLERELLHDQSAVSSK